MVNKNKKTDSRKKECNIISIKIEQLTAEKLNLQVDRNPEVSNKPYGEVKGWIVQKEGKGKIIITPNQRTKLETWRKRREIERNRLRIVLQRSKEPSEVLTKTTKPSHRLSIERLEKRYLRVWQIRMRIEEELRMRNRNEFGIPTQRKTHSTLLLCHCPLLFSSINLYYLLFSMSTGYRRPNYEQDNFFFFF